MKQDRRICNNGLLYFIIFPVEREGKRVQFSNQPQRIEIRSLTLKPLKEGDGNFPDLLREICPQCFSCKLTATRHTSAR